VEVLVRMRPLPPDRAARVELARAHEAELLEERQDAVRGRTVDARSGRRRTLDDLVDGEVGALGAVRVVMRRMMLAAIPTAMPGVLERRPDRTAGRGEAVARIAQHSLERTLILLDVHAAVPVRSGRA
jgi:hypothetical protein